MAEAVSKMLASTRIKALVSRDVVFACAADWPRLVFVGSQISPNNGIVCLTWFFARLSRPRV